MEDAFKLYWIPQGKNCDEFNFFPYKHPCIELLDNELDAILIPAFWGDLPHKVNTVLDAQRDLIAKLSLLKRDTLVMTYCTSVHLLAASGRLNGNIATSTWWLSESLHHMHSNILWNFSQEVILNNNNLTVAGGLGYIEIAKKLIHDKCGRDVISAISELMLLPTRQKGLKPFLKLDSLNLKNDLLRRLHLWVLKTAATSISLKTLSIEFNMTEKTLSRKVLKLSGISCAELLRLMKCQQAAHLLIKTNKQIGEIAHTLGFQTDASFRRTYKALTSLSPSQYRKSYSHFDF
jgi:transcriptional regulator GlxA family with amidase domain